MGRPLLSDLAQDIADVLAGVLQHGGDVSRADGQHVLRLVWQLRDALEDREAAERRRDVVASVRLLPAGVADLAAARRARAGTAP